MIDDTVRPPGDADPGARPKRILITLLHPGYARNYEEALRGLLERGYRVHILMLIRSKQARDRVAERLGEEFSNLTISPAPKPKADGWRNLRWSLRLMADYARYLHPRFKHATALRNRVAEKMFGTRRNTGWVLAASMTLLVKVGGRFRGARYSDLLVAVFLRVERTLPISDRIDDTIKAFAPDAVIASPYVAVGSREPDFLLAAQRLGIRTGIFVASWDNLTNKGLIKMVPDRVFVWNVAQKHEAVEMHGIPAENVVVTGAQRFDDWFARSPRWDHAGFTSMVGLREDRPIILYLCSSPFIAPDEVAFVRRFITAVRSAPGSISEAGILVRPHPQNASQWLDTDLDDLREAVVWPPAGEQPIDAISRAGFFDSIYHSLAVVGINTSAQIEAGIVGKTVHTVLDAQFSQTQSGTLHFHHLLAENGGLLFQAPDLQGLVADLQRASDGELDSEQTIRFIESFVRPNGLRVPATPIFIDEVESLCALPPLDLYVPTVADSLIRRALTPLAIVCRPKLISTGWRWLRTKAGRPLDAVPRSPDQAVAVAAKRALRPIGRQSESAIIVGPWLGDVTQEVLYWIPFVRWATQRASIESKRLVAVSRDGANDLYANFCDGYVDIRDLTGSASAEEHADWASGEPGLERLAIQALRAEVGADALHLGPSILRSLLARYWFGRSSMQSALRFLDMRTLHALPDEELEAFLPSTYLACAFAFSPVFPETKANRLLLTELVDRLSQEIPIVLLGSCAREVGAPMDMSPGPGVVRLIEDRDPRRTLHAHALALSRADGVVSTYGAMNHLAASLGVRSVGLVDEPRGLDLADVAMNDRLGAVTGGVTTLMDTRVLPLVQQLFSQRPDPLASTVHHRSSPEGSTARVSSMRIEHDQR